MIKLVEALNYRCLKYISQPLDRFHVLVGPNATGKTTFLDVISFLGCLVDEGPDVAINQRAPDYRDLIWQRKGDRFELAIEAVIPETLRGHLGKGLDTVRYQVAVGLDKKTNQAGILAESMQLKQTQRPQEIQLTFFPSEKDPPESILQPTRGGNCGRAIVTKNPGGNDNFYSENRTKNGSNSKGWFPSIHLGPMKSALGTLPEDEMKFPVATWLKRFLSSGIQNLQLNSLVIRQPSPPGRGLKFQPDGSNLPWVISHLQENDPAKFNRWLDHLKTTLPDLVNIRVIEREEDRNKYLKLVYTNNLEVPSWLVSDGTLRLLTLTLPAYLKELDGIFLVEEPENGIHPQAVETVYQSLSSVYDAQVLMATHSPVVLANAKPNEVLCFQKTDSGATDIVSGDKHPQLQAWQEGTTLGDYLAAGIL